MKQVAFNIVFIVFVTFSTSAQDVTKDELKREIVFNGNRYKVYNNWVSGGAGVAYNSGTPRLQFAGGVDYNFHIKDNYFQAGFLLSGDEFRNYNNTQLHFCFGKRNETNWFNLAMFGGIAYSTGYKNSKILKPYQTVGLYGNLQVVRKLKYDIGIGLSTFADINLVQSIGGVQLILYFSGAYKGKAK